MSPDVYALKRFGGGSGSIIWGNVQCTGNEASLSNCSALLVNDCEHPDVAGVTCLSGKLRFYVEKRPLHLIICLLFGMCRIALY